MTEPSVDGDLIGMMATGLSPDRVLAHVTRDRDTGEHSGCDDALELLHRFGAVRFEADVAALLALLRARDQLADALVVLEGVALDRPPAESAKIAMALERDAPEDTEQIIDFVARHRRPREVARFMDALAAISAQRATTTAFMVATLRSIADVARVELALYALGHKELAEMTVRTTLDLRSSAREVADLFGYQTAFGSQRADADNSLTVEHVINKMPVGELAGFLSDEYATRPGRAITLLAGVVDSRRRSIHALVELSRGLLTHAQPVLVDELTTAVATARPARDLVDYAVGCGGRCVPELFTAVAQRRDGDLVGDLMMRWQVGRTEAEGRALVELLAEHASVSTLLDADAYLDQHGQSSAAEHLLKTALDQPKRFVAGADDTDAEARARGVAQLLAAFCRDHSRRWRHSAASVPRATVRLLAESYDDLAWASLEPASYFAELAAAVDDCFVGDQLSHLSRPVCDDIGDAVFNRHVRGLNEFYAAELRSRDKEQLALDFLRRLEP